MQKMHLDCRSSPTHLPQTFTASSLRLCKNTQYILRHQSPNVRCFNRKPGWKLDERGENHAVLFEYLLLGQSYLAQYSLLMLGSRRGLQLPVSHAVTRGNNDSRVLCRQGLWLRSVFHQVSSKYAQHSVLCQTVGFVLGHFIQLQADPM